jgi:ubiquinone/menaquinone biosynthesis C-methylase UbiE
MDISEYGVMYRLEQSYWWFLGKQFLVREQVKRLLVNRGTGSRILDIGSGTGIILKTLEEFGQAFGMEMSREAIQFLKKRSLKRVVCSNAEQVLPFKNNSFSLVTCLDVLEHLDHDKELLAEMVRVCEDGGHVLVTVPAFNRLWSPHDTVLHHRRRYTKTRLQAIIRSTEFRVVKISYFNLILSFPIMAIRKIRASWLLQTQFHSDFSIELPPLFNKALTYLYRAEIALLCLLNYPFGVSLVAVLERPKREEPDVKS